MSKWTKDKRTSRQAFIRRTNRIHRWLGCVNCTEQTSLWPTSEHETLWSGQTKLQNPDTAQESSTVLLPRRHPPRPLHLFIDMHVFCMYSACILRVVRDQSDPCVLIGPGLGGIIRYKALTSARHYRARAVAICPRDESGGVWGVCGVWGRGFVSLLLLDRVRVQNEE